MKNLKKITEIIEDNSKYEERTNVGYIINDVEYIYGKYIVNERKINKDVDGDSILEDVLYVNNGNNEYYKVGEEDIYE